MIFWVAALGRCWDCWGCPAATVGAGVGVAGTGAGVGGGCCATAAGALAAATARTVARPPVIRRDTDSMLVAVNARAPRTARVCPRLTATGTTRPARRRGLPWA